MSVWLYNPSFAATPEEIVYGHRTLSPEEGRFWDDLVSKERCPYCASALVELPQVATAGSARDDFEASGQPVAVCQLCGWWKASYAIPHSARRDIYGNVGALKKLDLTDLTVPIDEIRAYLFAQFDRRFDIHPRLMEETVAAVMRDFGFSCDVTAYSGDGGIDAILHRPDGSAAGIQVKRYRNKIKVEQLRAFVGALVLGGLTSKRR